MTTSLSPSRLWPDCIILLIGLPTVMLFTIVVFPGLMVFTIVVFPGVTLIAIFYLVTDGVTCTRPSSTLSIIVSPALSINDSSTSYTYLPAFKVSV